MQLLIKSGYMNNLNQNRMKTAVEWLLEQYVNKGIITIEDIEQANKMFEEQVIDAYETSHISMMTAKQYYKETFKTN